MTRSCRQHLLAVRTMSKRSNKSEAIEMEPLRKDKPTSSLAAGFAQASDKARATVAYEEGNLDSISAWSIGAASWLFIQAMPLLLFPRLILFFTQTASLKEFTAASSRSANRSSGDHFDALTPLEAFLCSMLGWGCIGFASVCLVTIQTHIPTNPLRLPLLFIATTLFTLLAFICYNTHAKAIGSGLATVLAFGHAAIALWGWWVAVFGNDGLRSHKTGADKRTSSFPFKNSASASVQKHDWKKAQRS